RASVRTRNGDTFQSRAVVITLPLGILKTGSVRFSPTLGQKRVLIDKLGWGQVARITLRFKPTLWNVMPPALGARHGRAFGFVNAPGLPYSVWWALRAPAPILTGWAGGERAEALLGIPESRRVRLAVDSLAGIFET